MVASSTDIIPQELGPASNLPHGEKSQTSTVMLKIISFFPNVVGIRLARMPILARIGQEAMRRQSFGYGAWRNSLIKLGD